MKQIPITNIPAADLRAAEKAHQGTLIEETYPVRHYIDAKRRLVASPGLDDRQAGRETVEGAPLVKTCNVYLPAGYDASTRYPVLYLLHGVGGDPDEWIKGSGTVDGRPVICNLLDHLIARGEVEPLIVVFPNGRSCLDFADKTFDFAGINMLGFYYFDYELRYDLIPHIESTYSTRANIRDGSAEGVAYSRGQRAIAGLSMGGMQVLNLVLGGFRHDYADGGLAPTVRAPGMLDLFSQAGAFSNAPTSSEGHILGASVQSSGHALDLLYLTCGDADNISDSIYRNTVEGLADASGDALKRFYEVTLQGGAHDFQVWNHGAYHFLKLLCFGSAGQTDEPEIVRMTLEDFAP